MDARSHDVKTESDEGEMIPKTENSSTNDVDVDNDDDENWEIYSSDDEEHSKKIWEPSPEKIIELYTNLANGKVPELTWVCPGRREPSVIGEDDDDDEETPDPEEAPAEPTAFDFDSMFSEPQQPIGQRKSVGTLKVQQKRVASLDKILNDMKKGTSKFPLQSPRVPYDSIGRGIRTLPGADLFSVKSDELGMGIPLPSAYTLTSPYLPISSSKILEKTAEEAMNISATPGTDVSLSSNSMDNDNEQVKAQMSENPLSDA